MTTTWVDISGLPPSGTYPVWSYPFTGSNYIHYAPAVAYGQNAYSNYLVTECNNVIGFGDFFIMTPVGVACISPTSTFYEVNSTYPATSSNHANAVSTACNNTTDTAVTAWTNSGTIYYKRTFTPSYGYKYHGGAEQEGMTSGNGIRLWPNPTENILTFDNPHIADRYSIRNLMGQEILKGKIMDGEQAIDLRSITDGSYVISFYNGDKAAGNQVFVKN